MPTNQQKSPLEHEVSAYLAHYVEALIGLAKQNTFARLYVSSYPKNGSIKEAYYMALRPSEDTEMMITEEYDHPARALDEIRYKLERRSR